MRLLYLLIALAVLFLIPFLLWGENMESYFSQQGTVDWLRSYGNWAWLAAVVLLLLDLFLPIPATVVMAALGIVYGPVIGGLIGALGAISAGMLGYGLCRLLGRGTALRILGEHDLQIGERLFADIGGWLVVFSRWLPIFPELIACMAGLTRMPAMLFMAATICGCAPLAFTFTTIGYLGVSQPLLTLMLSALLPLVLWLFVRTYILRQTITR